MPAGLNCEACGELSIERKNWDPASSNGIIRAMHTHFKSLEGKPFAEVFKHRIIVTWDNEAKEGYIPVEKTGYCLE